MNHLDDPRLFLRVVETGSMKALSDEIGADPATVTRRLGALEARLQVKLLDRSRKGVTPTEAGTAYYKAMRRLIADIDAVEADVSGFADKPRGLVRVSCPLDFGRVYVTKWMLDLQRVHSDLSVDLILRDDYVDLASQDIDVALRISDLADSALMARALGHMRLILVASPGYLAGVPPIVGPGDLKACEFVLYTWMQFGRTAPLVGPEGQTTRMPLSSRLSISNLGAARAAVLEGAGIHIGPEWAFADDIKAGRLNVVLPGWAPPAAKVSAVFRPGPYMPAKTRAVIDCFANAFPMVDGITSLGSGAPQAVGQVIR